MQKEEQLLMKVDLKHLRNWRCWSGFGSLMVDIFVDTVMAYSVAHPG